MERRSAKVTKVQREGPVHGHGHGAFKGDARFEYSRYSGGVFSWGQKKTSWEKDEIMNTLNTRTEHFGVLNGVFI